MIVGFAGGKGGMLYPQILTLRRLIPRLRMDFFVHCGSGSGDHIVHNMVRALSPDTHVVVVPIIDEHSVIASVDIGSSKELIWQRLPRKTAELTISKLVWGMIFVDGLNLSADGLYRLATRRSIPKLIIRQNGKMELHRGI